MNLKLLLPFSLLLSTAITSSVSAAEVGWVYNREVSQIVTVINGGINVRLIPELTGCVSQSGYGQHFASIYPSHPGKELFQSNLLAAMMSGKKVSLYFSDDKCTVTEMIISK